MQHAELPPPDSELKIRYQKLIENIDLAMERLIAVYPENTLRCAPGCSTCCMPFAVSALEAAILSDRIPELLQSHPTQEQYCSFLVNDHCLIYTLRPILCRTQGLPIGYIDTMSNTIEVSACPLNFPAEFQFQAENVLLMDQFNEELAQLNIEYCIKNELDPHKRIPLACLFHQGDSRKG